MEVTRTVSNKTSYVLAGIVVVTIIICFFAGMLIVLRIDRERLTDINKNTDKFFQLSASVDSTNLRLLIIEKKVDSLLVAWNRK